MKSESEKQKAEKPVATALQQPPENRAMPSPADRPLPNGAPDFTKRRPGVFSRSILPS